MGCSTSSPLGISTRDKKGNMAEESVILHDVSTSQRNQIEPIRLTKSVFDEYWHLENEIRKLEKKNVQKKYEAKSWYAIELKKNVDHLDATYKELTKRTEKEKADVDNIQQAPVRAFLRKQGTYEEKFQREQKEYMEALNRQEEAHKALQEAVSQYQKAISEAEYHKGQCDTMNELHDRQEVLIEYQLDNRLEEATEWQQRIALAKFRWTNGRVLLVHAAVQMAFGIKRWKELDTIDMNSTRLRYFAAAEARSNFISAGQNIRSCQVYLGKVQFPYCKEGEMEDFEKSISNTFIDCHVKDKWRAALSLYEMICGSVSALIQWFDQVINVTILRDLEEANSKVSSIQQDLRRERFRLIQEKAKEGFDHDIQADYDETDEDDQDEKEWKTGTTASTSMPKHLSPPQAELLPPSTYPSLEPLAPVPPNDTLFGSINDLKRQHEKEKAELEKQRELAKAKMDHGLQQKLQQRRKRKEFLQA